VDSTTTTQPTMSSQDEASSDHRPIRRQSTHRRSSIGVTMDGDKGRTSPSRRRMSNDGGKERSTRSRTVRRRSLDLDTTRDSRDQNVALRKLDSTSTGRRRSVSPRRTADKSASPRRTINLVGEEESKHRSKSRPRRNDDAKSSNSGSRSKSRSRKPACERSATAVADSPALLHPRSFTRTVSSRIRDIGITPEQILLLQKCGLTITNTQ
jgi:hypothetical protein